MKETIPMYVFAQRSYLKLIFNIDLFFLVFIVSLTMFNLLNTIAHSEGCSNLFGVATGYYESLKENPNFVPTLSEHEQSVSLESIAHQKFLTKKESETALNLLKLKQEQNLPLIDYKKLNQVIPVSEIYAGIKEDLSSNPEHTKLKKLLYDLVLIEKKYTAPNTIHLQKQFYFDINKLFVDYTKATDNDYQNITKPINPVHNAFNENLKTLYKNSNGNVILLNALCTFNKNCNMFSILHQVSSSFDYHAYETKTYNNLLFTYKDYYKK